MPQKRITVQIRLRPYLKAFIISIYGQEPVFFPKRDRFNDLLQLLLTKPPADHIQPHPDKSKLEVVLPYFENLNILYNHYLSDKAQKAFEERVKKRFWVIYDDFMDECLRKDLTRSTAISLFIEKYQLPYDSKIEDMLRKAIYRSVKIQTKYPKRQYNHKSRKKHVR